MISIITCARPGGVSYLNPLLIAINDVCESPNKFLFCDGNSESYPGWQSKTFDLKAEKLGKPDNKYIGWKTFEKAYELGEDLLFLEDDAFPVDSASMLDAINYTVPSNCAFTSFYRSKWTTPGIHGAQNFGMSQAVKIPYRSFEHLFGWRRVSSGDWEAVIGVDVAMAVAGHNARWLYEQTERNYFKHLGEVSAIRNDANGHSFFFE